MAMGLLCDGPPSQNRASSTPLIIMANDSKSDFKNGCIYTYIHTHIHYIINESCRIIFTRIREYHTVLDKPNQVWSIPLLQILLHVKIWLTMTVSPIDSGWSLGHRIEQCQTIHSYPSNDVCAVCQRSAICWLDQTLTVALTPLESRVSTKVLITCNIISFQHIHRFTNKTDLCLFSDEVRGHVCMCESMDNRL